MERIGEHEFREVRRPVIALTGGYLSQNMGAAAMTVVAAERLASLGYEVELFSKYPNDDANFAARYGVTIRRANQFVYTLLVLPLIATASIVAPLRRWIRGKYFGNIVGFFDVGGITFSADRGLAAFAINLTWLSLPLLLRVPVVKGSQALGPFDRWYLRPVPRLLKKVDAIYARGAESEQFLARAGVDCESAPDIAFLLRPEDAPCPAAPYVAVVPSSVIMRQFDRLRGRGAYEHMMAEVVETLAADGHNVVLLAHSYRRGETHNNNDYPLAESVARRMASPRVELYDVFGKTPGQLKTVLGGSEVALTSRFHAMVAAVSLCVPVVVPSWSHKYREVLDLFELGKWAFPWQEATAERLLQLTAAARFERESISKKIASRLPEVQRRSELSFQSVSRIAR